MISDCINDLYTCEYSLSTREESEMQGATMQPHACSPCDQPAVTQSLPTPRGAGRRFTSVPACSYPPACSIQRFQEPCNSWLPDYPSYITALLLRIASCHGGLLSELQEIHLLRCVCQAKVLKALKFWPVVS